MSARIAKWVAWSMCALAVVLTIAGVPLAIIAANAASNPATQVPPAAAKALQASPLDVIGTLLISLGVLAFSALGAVIVSRYPSHAIGWIFCVYGLLSVAEPFAAYYAVWTLFLAPGVLPGGLTAAWFQNWIWVVSSALLSAYVPLLFPTGRLPSRRWRPVWWMATIATVLLSLGFAFHVGPLFNHLEAFNIPNPYAIEATGDLFAAFTNLPFDLLLLSMLLAAISLIVRLRRAHGEERRQIKWFGYFGALLAGLFVLQGIVRYTIYVSTPTFEWLYTLSWPLAFVALPIATGLAILRYHLFDIDVLIRLTLVYGTLTALLAGVYVGLVIAGQAAVRALTGQRGQQAVVIVATTLLVATLVTPLRRGIQAAIDRRFYRHKVDAARTLAAFGVTLHSEVDLEELSMRLLSVVDETVRPMHVSLWLCASAAEEAEGGPAAQEVRVSSG